MRKKLFGGLLFLLCPIFLHAQAVSPVTPRQTSLSAGGYFSFGGSDYGQNLGFTNRIHPDMYGPGAYADFDYHVWRNIDVGIEAEARFLDYYHSAGGNGLGAGTEEQNFLAGPRVSYELGRRWQPYVKFLAGGSRFHYPSFISKQAYDYTTVVGGGGIDFHLSPHITLRPGDFEYQHWEFPPTGLTPWVYSAGISYRFF
ncbi:MAG: outer membrane beta-barrel protein [Acidobacteriaceae bacterium]